MCPLYGLSRTDGRTNFWLWKSPSFWATIDEQRLERAENQCPRAIYSRICVILKIKRNFFETVDVIVFLDKTSEFETGQLAQRENVHFVPKLPTKNGFTTPWRRCFFYIHDSKTYVTSNHQKISPWISAICCGQMALSKKDTVSLMCK